MTEHDDFFVELVVNLGIYERIKSILTCFFQSKNITNNTVISHIAVLRSVHLQKQV